MSYDDKPSDGYSRCLDCLYSRGCSYVKGENTKANLRTTCGISAEKRSDGKELDLYAKCYWPCPFGFRPIRN